MQQEIHGVPTWELREILEKLGAASIDENEFSGNGWHAIISRLPDYFIGRLPFCSHLVVFSGEADILQGVWRQFELRVLRPGG